MDTQLKMPSKADVLITEMNHRWCNSLQIISSSLKHLCRDGPESGRLSRRLEDLNDQIQAMAALHRRLAHLPSTGELFESYCGALCLDLLLAFGRTDVTPLLTIMEPRLDGCLRQHLALLVTELMTNALKHGKPPASGGMVEFNLSPFGLDHMLLSVIDNFEPPALLQAAPKVVEALVADLKGGLFVDLTPVYQTRIIIPNW
jgi:two-component sensor histidine kinase